jgi:hypothetical protein
MTMTANEPDAEGWRRLFASLTGDAAVDAGIVRAFCDAHGVTAARVMAEMHARRRTDPEETRGNEGPRHGS